MLELQDDAVKTSCFLFLQHRRPGLAQSAIEGFPGNLGNQRLQQPAQSKRNVAGQRQSLALHVNAAVFLLKSPIGVEPPEITSALTDGPLLAIRMVGVLYLSNLSADGMRIDLQGFYLAPVG